MRQVQSSVVSRVMGTVECYLQSQMALGRLRPCNTEIVTRTFMGSIAAFLLLRHVLQDERAQALPVEQVVDGITDVVLHGILPVDR